MNYLAHAYLSFGQPELLTGNMISDYVKGRKKYEYPEKIQKGISLHREIDQFTDHHPANQEAKDIFRPAYRLYSSSILDVIYDHYLAIDEKEFSEPALKQFADETYLLLDEFSQYFPEKFSLLFPYMKSQNWLYNYRHRWGIERSLGGLVRRSLYMKESDTAYKLFNENYDTLRSCYKVFFPEVKKLAMEFTNKLGRR